MKATQREFINADLTRDRFASVEQVLLIELESSDISKKDRDTMMELYRTNKSNWDKWEKDNQRDFYVYGRNKGMIIGGLVALGATILGEAIGEIIKLVKSKHD